MKHNRSQFMILFRWLLIFIVGIPLVFYIAYVILFYNQQRILLFPAQDRLPLIAGESNDPTLVKAVFPTSLGAEAGFAWYLPPQNTAQPAPAVIIGHGNGEIADDWVGHADILRQRGFGVLILGYPGYGHAAGSPSKDSIVEASLAAYDWLITQPEIAPDQILIFGHSIGGAATLAIAQERPTQGAILLSTFASIDHIARDRYLPAILAKDRFDNLSIISGYDRPVYMMHGSLDTLVRPHHAERLHAAAPNAELHWLSCGHGGCIGDIYQFWDKLEPVMHDMLRNA